MAASVDSVGARVSVAPEPAHPGKAKYAGHTFGIALFAQLVDGQRVTTAPVTTIGASVLPGSVGELMAAVERALSHEGLTAKHRASFWGPLVSALADAGVRTDPETLLRLPFQAETEDEVVALFE
jgi:hypothetical protein